MTVHNYHTMCRPYLAWDKAYVVHSGFIMHLFYRNTVKAFYTAGMIYDVLTTFGDLTDEAAQNCKYAKWKAAYIHNCLKNGETPVPGMKLTLFIPKYMFYGSWFCQPRQLIFSRKTLTRVPV